MILSKLANLFRKRNRRSATAPRRASLQVECLEGREVPSATPVAWYYVNTAHTLGTWFETNQLLNRRPDGSVSAGNLAYQTWDYINTNHTIQNFFAAGKWTSFNNDGSARFRLPGE